MNTKPAVAVPTTTRVGSKTVTVFPVIGCLVRAEEVVGENPCWKPANEEQRRLLEDVFSKGRREVEKIPEHQLRSIASKSVETINAFLREQGFSIQLKPFQDEQSFGVASVLRVPVKWRIPGERFDLRTEQGNFPGVSMDSGVRILRTARHPNPIASIDTETEDRVYMTVADTPLDGLELLEKIRSFGSKYHFDSSYDGLEFPMVSYDHEVDIRWLEGLWAQDEDGNPWYIRQAIQQTRFRMNERGARTESAAAMEMETCSWGPSETPPKLRIDHPFYFWKVRRGLSQPLFVAYFEEDVWADPGA